MKNTTLEKGFYKTAFLLAFPIAMQNLLVSCASLIDTSMVMALGNVYTSAVGIAGRLAFLLNVVSFGFCSGSAALISQFWGAKEFKNIKKTYGTALVFALPVALLFASALFFFPSLLMKVFTEDEAVIKSGAEYLKYYSFACIFVMFSQITCSSLRATERVKLPLLSSLISVIVNTFFNYCLIGGNLGFPRLEMKGAAIATVLGAFTQALVLFLFILFSNNPLRAGAGELFVHKKEFIARFFNVALPVLFNESLWAVGTNIYAMVIARQGTDNHAAFTVYDTFQQLFFVFFVGICNAAAIMVGKRIGEGNKRSAFATASRFVILTPTVGAVISVFMVLLRMPILRLLPVEKPETVALAATILLGYAVWLPFKMLPYTLICGIFRAGGDTKAGCVFDATSLYLFGIPTVVILGFFSNIPFEWLVWIMYVAEDIPKAAVCLPHFLKKKWIRELSDRATSGED